MTDHEHGSNAGYAAHKRAKTDPCAPCSAAHATYMRAWRARPKEPTVAQPTDHPALEDVSNAEHAADSAQRALALVPSSPTTEVLRFLVEASDLQRSALRRILANPPIAVRPSSLEVGGVTVTAYRSERAADRVVVEIDTDGDEHLRRPERLAIAVNDDYVHGGPYAERSVAELPSQAAVTALLEQVRADLTGTPPACEAGICACPPAPDGYDQHADQAAAARDAAARTRIHTRLVDFGLSHGDAVRVVAIVDEEDERASSAAFAARLRP